MAKSPAQKNRIHDDDDLTIEELSLDQDLLTDSLANDMDEVGDVEFLAQLEAEAAVKQAQKRKLFGAFGILFLLGSLASLWFWWQSKQADVNTVPIITQAPETSVPDTAEPTVVPDNALTENEIADAAIATANMPETTVQSEVIDPVTASANNTSTGSIARSEPPTASTTNIASSTANIVPATDDDLKTPVPSDPAIIGEEVDRLKDEKERLAKKEQLLKEQAKTSEELITLKEKQLAELKAKLESMN